MALNIVDKFKALFRYTNVDRISEPLNFVHLFGFEKSYGKPHPQDFKKQVEDYKSWVYACANKNATSVAKCQLCLYKKSYDNRKENEELVKITEHPFLDLIKSVNPFSNRFELLTLTQIFQELTGNAYWYLPKNALGIPERIWVIPSHWVRIVPSETKFVAGYVVQVPGKGHVIPYEEDEIIHFKFPSPLDLFYGVGPLYAAKFGVDLNEQIKTW